MTLVPAQTWVDYQSPSVALTRLFEIHGWTMIRWHPKSVILARGKDSDTEYKYGFYNWPLEKWIKELS